MPTKIEWANNYGDMKGETWNPVHGCTPVSEGCLNCYAKRMATRLAGRCGYPKDEPFRVTLRPDRLDQPLHWRKPRMIFVCSMSDLFHEDVPDEFIKAVFLVIAGCSPNAQVRILNNRPVHTFLILTKRLERALAWYKTHLGPESKPLPNLWLGVTAENQKRADERIPVLLQIPAAVRFVSVEPMLSVLKLTEYLWRIPHIDKYRINWVICGGESGPGARPMHPAWARSLRDQCVDAGVPYFFKQWGAWKECERIGATAYAEPIDAKRTEMLAPDGSHQYLKDRPDVAVMSRIGKKKAGRLLDGREWNEYPEVKP